MEEEVEVKEWKREAEGWVKIEKSHDSKDKAAAEVCC